MAKKSFKNWGIISFAAFLILSKLVFFGIFGNFDLRTTVSLQSFLPEILITPFSFLSVIGSAEISSIFMLTIWFLIPALRRIRILFLYGLVSFIEIAGKTIIAKEAPPIEFLKTNLHIGFPSGEISQHFFSYPSGHSARTAFICGVIILAIWASRKLNDSQKQILIGSTFVFSAVMFISRVYLGEHWMTDVLGGALLGFSLALFAGTLILRKA